MVPLMLTRGAFAQIVHQVIRLEPGSLEEGRLVDRTAALLSNTAHTKGITQPETALYRYLSVPTYIPIPSLTA